MEPIASPLARHRDRLVLAAAAAFCTLLAFHSPSRCEAPPPPTYATYNDPLSAGGSGLQTPQQGAALIASRYGARPQTAGWNLPPVFCSANAAQFSVGDFPERSTPSNMSAFTVSRSVTWTYGRCVSYLHTEYCNGLGCVPGGNGSYQMYATCPSAELAFKAPNKCVCTVPGTTYHNASARCLPIVDIDHTRSKPRHCPKGNPVYPLTGARVQNVPLGISLAGIELVLTYTSLSELPTDTAAYTSAEVGLPAFGPLWSSNFHRHLKVPPGMVSSYGITAVRGNGFQQTFVPNVNNQLVSSDPGNSSYLVRNDVYLDRADRMVEQYSVRSGAQPIYRWYRDSGETLSFAHAATLGGPELTSGTGDYVVRVSDNFGRRLRFEYEMDPGGTGARVWRIERPDGRFILLGYTQSMLTSVTWPDGTTQRFAYADPNNPRLMTARIDETAVAIGNYEYNAAGHAIVTQSANGIGRFGFSYASPPQVKVVEQFATNRILRTKTFVPPSEVTIIDPANVNLRLVPAAASGDMLGAQDQPAGAGCDAATQWKEYDANGSVSRKDDFNGNRTCFANDLSRNVELVRVEGLATGAGAVSCPAVTPAGAALPVGSRKVTTQWHPTWNVQTRVAEPGRITTYVYNGQPDPLAGGAIATCSPGVVSFPHETRPISVLCRKVEQATTDLTGALGFAAPLDSTVALRQWRWTYDTRARMLSARGPRLDVNDTTTYSYYATTTAEYTVGDLWKITNPLGQVTEFTRYNKMGQALSVRDPNQVVTAYTYDLRDRLTSMTVGGQTTTWEYWPHGMLKRVTQPDGISFVAYEYDAAQRLRQLNDNLGNAITYTLDNLGNRLAEDVKDPTGMLRRIVSRSIDALGRVSQVTGRE